MIKFENTEVMGWEHAIRGMRNPMNSWEKSDSDFYNKKWPEDPDILKIGPNDLDLMKRLRNAGTDHRKFMRMITVYVDITAPLYWWKEFDTYRVGVTPNPTDIEINSCSTMHKIADREFEWCDFSTEHLDRLTYFDKHTFCLENRDYMNQVIIWLNMNRDMYLKTKDKKYWWQMIQLLPTSYNQKRTVMMNYEVLANIYKSRKNHKLDEWSVGFMEWIKSLPYSELITGEWGEEAGPRERELIL